MPKNLSKVLEKFQGTLFKLDGLEFLSDIVFASTKCRYCVSFYKNPLPFLLLWNAI